MINYSRTQTNSNNKTVPRVSGRGEDTTNWKMNYSYKATVAVVESPEQNGSSIGKTSINQRAFFRTIFVDKTVNGGTWKLKIENTGTFEAVAVISAWSDAVKTQK